MSIPHEEAAKKIHPSASEFRHVRRTLAPGLYGWVFQVKKPDTSIPSWSWVTCGLEVSEDTTSRNIAERNLRAYVKHQPSGGRRVVASGTRSIAVGGSLSGNAIGPNSVVSTGESLTLRKEDS